MKNIVKIAGVYIGIIIGAGFASGQEINRFFIYYGSKWILGMILTGIFFCVLGSAVLNIIYENKIDTYHDFMHVIMGKSTAKAMEWISGIFLCILFFTMTAATGAVAKEAFGFHYIVGVYALLIGCFFVFLFDVRGIIAINSILAPLLIISAILIGIYSCIMEKFVPVFSIQETIYNSKWAASSILYVSYNMITAISVLISMKSLIVSKKIAVCSAILGSISMIIIGLCIGTVLFLHYENVKELEIPMLAIIDKYSIQIKYIYIFMLLAAIFTTAIGNGFGAICWIQTKLNWNNYIIKLVFLTLAGFVSFIGFSGFVGKLYPLFGVIGMIEIIFILKQRMFTSIFKA